MKRILKHQVELSPKGNLSNEFVYDQALKRVSDLNRSSFSYRTLYATIIAAYIGALTLLADFSTSSLILPSIEAYTLALHGVTLVVFAVTLVICFYDYIFQEIIERSLRTAERIENRSPGFGWGEVALVAHRKGSITSLTIATNMFLFYFVPVASLFSIVALTAELVVPEPVGKLNAMVAGSMCDVAYALGSVDPYDLETTFNILRAKQHLNTGLSCQVPVSLPELVGSLGDPLVLNEVSPEKFIYEFSDSMRRIVGLGYIVALSMFIYFFFYSFWRISARIFVVLCETRYAPLLPDVSTLSALRKVAGFTIASVIMLVFGFGVFSTRFSEKVVSYSLFFL